MSRAAGLDAGRFALRLAQVAVRKGVIHLERYHRLPLEAGESPQEAATELLPPLRRRLAPLRAGLTGSDVMIRYLQVPPVEDWRLERLMEFEVRELEAKSSGGLATDFNILPVPKEMTDEDTLLLALAREDLVSDWLEALPGLPVRGFTPNAIALYNAYLALGDHAPGVTLLANLGASTLDLALVRGSELYFARSLSTPLEERDATLAKRLGVSQDRARLLIHKYLDIEGCAKNMASAEGEKVTRPLLPLYESLPTLLSGIVTLCRAQARLQDLKLDRVLLCGGAASAKGLSEFLASRMSIPVEVWNPIELLDDQALDDAQHGDLQTDGPAAVVPIGLALSAADPEMYAVELLPKAVRKSRDFRERGLFNVLAAFLALVYLIADYSVTSSRAGEMSGLASQLGRQVKKREAAQERFAELELEVAQAEQLSLDLQRRWGVARTAQEMLALVREQLPADLWVTSFEARLDRAADWDRADEQGVPVVQVRGSGSASSGQRVESLFGQFAERVTAMLPSGELARRVETRGAGRKFEWSLSLHLLAPPIADQEEAE